MPPSTPSWWRARARGAGRRSPGPTPVRPQALAARLFEHEHTVEARIHDDRQGLFVKTRRPDDFYLLLNSVITEQRLKVESVAPVDDDLNAVYQYLITTDGGQAS